jgi:type II secretory pathway pseudopilin PulG
MFRKNTLYTPPVPVLTGRRLFLLIVLIGAVIFLKLFLSRTLAQNRDEQRMKDLNLILNAIEQRKVDNHGTFEGTNNGNHKLCTPLPYSPLYITSDSFTSPRSIGLDCLVTTYLESIPYDPSSGRGANTGYRVFVDGNGRTNVVAETPEPSIPRIEPLSVIR